MFTKRVVADSDPAEPSTPQPLAAGAAGAIGTGRAYVWKDKYLVELQYNNEQETPEALARSSAKISRRSPRPSDRDPGPHRAPPAVRALPAEHRIANGVQLVPKDALGFTGFGPLAVGYYAEGTHRYRLVALLGADDAKAEEAWKLVRARPGALPVADVGSEAVLVSVPLPARPRVGRSRVCRTCSRGRATWSRVSATNSSPRGPGDVTPWTSRSPRSPRS